MWSKILQKFQSDTQNVQFPYFEEIPPCGFIGEFMAIAHLVSKLFYICKYFVIFHKKSLYLMICPNNYSKAHLDPRSRKKNTTFTLEMYNFGHFDEKPQPQHNVVKKKELMLQHYEAHYSVTRSIVKQILQENFFQFKERLSPNS